MATSTDIISAPTIENHIPFTPQIRGKINTAITSKTTVRIKEIIAEMSPLFRAVKKADANIEKPANKKIKEKKGIYR